MNSNFGIGCINIEQAVKTIRWDDKGLVPAVVQDIDSGEVLMMAYMNEEALKKTLEGGKACYFSRSRNSLWLKGETSGHYQDVVDVRLDCDQDTILLKVKQNGMACHENFFSCFHYELNHEGTTAVPEGQEQTDAVWQKVGEPNTRPVISLGSILELLAEVIHDRNTQRPEGAYTTYLFTKGVDKILKKVGEECAEVIIAAKNNSTSEIRYEASDLLYHLLVLLEDRHVDLQEIADELASRRK